MITSERLHELIVNWLLDDISKLWLLFVRATAKKLTLLALLLDEGLEGFVGHQAFDGDLEHDEEECCEHEDPHAACGQLRVVATEQRHIRCVRLFQDQAGWVPHYRDE